MKFLDTRYCVLDLGDNAFIKMITKRCSVPQGDSIAMILFNGVIQPVIDLLGLNCVKIVAR